MKNFSLTGSYCSRIFSIPDDAEKLIEICSLRR